MAKKEKYYTGLALNFGQTIRNWAAQSAQQLRDAYAMQKVWDGSQRNAVWSGRKKWHYKDMNDWTKGRVQINSWWEENEWRKQQAIELQEQRVATEKATDELSKTRELHEQKLASMDQERAALTRKQQEQEAKVADLQKRNKELQVALDQDRKRMAEVEKTIERMIQEEIRRAEEARRKAEEEAKKRAEAEARKKADKQGKNTASNTKSNTSTKSSSSGSTASKSSSSSSASSSARTYAVDESYKRLTGSFASNKGKMPYPVDATFAFVDHYNTAGNGNSSIVISSKVGAHACAIYEGVVQGCFSTSEEWTIIVQHGQYRSVYMNLANVSVKVGQHVNTRQALGTLKTEPDGKRSELRFWIYQNANAVNPERWLKR